MLAAVAAKLSIPCFDFARVCFSKFLTEFSPTFVYNNKHVRGKRVCSEKKSFNRFYEKVSFFITAVGFNRSRRGAGTVRFDVK
jgi:hypothetical protein